MKIMEWKKLDNWKTLKEGTICRTNEGNFVIVGEINTSMGVNDEFTEDITHYTEDKIEFIRQLLKDAENDFLAQTVA